MNRLVLVSFSACITAFLMTVGNVDVTGQNLGCKLNPETSMFAGSASEQARCLLRPNAIGGVLGEPRRELPDPLEKILGKPVSIKKERLRRFLTKSEIAESDLGGLISEPLSTAKLQNGTVMPATYFVIHDTSSPYLKDEPFPADAGKDPSWRGNILDTWTNQPVGHVFVNRLGKSITTTPFIESVRKGWGTKFARDLLKADAKGLQLHIELVQPRRRDPADLNPNNDRIAPVPGFTDEQYERLALLYICASVRRGAWMIPAFHAAIDAGIKDAHDDPQNFVLETFAAKLKKLIRKLD